MKILLVEDNDRVADFVVKGLKESGHVVDHAGNGRDGLFMATTETYDAMVLDRMLPGGIDGIRLLETLRSQNNSTPVLVLSALSQVDDRVAGLNAGADDYVIKPFSLDELLARLRRIDHGGDVALQNADDARRRAGARKQPVPAGDVKPFEAGLINGRHFGQYFRARQPGEAQRAQPA